ncbi:MAG: hypothetical protein AAGH64_09590 [Planctomycetota bacterium]
MKHIGIGLCVCACAHAGDPLVFVPVSVIELPGAEVVDFEARNGRLWCTSADGVHMLRREADGSFYPAFTYNSRNAELSHVACDPSGSGHVVVVGFGPPDNAIITALDHEHGVPHRIQFGGTHQYDCVTFAGRGRTVLIAAENEPRPSGVDAPGALVVVDGIVRRNLTQPDGPIHVRYDHSEPTEVRITDAHIKPDAGVRIHPSLVDTPAVDIEPEYIATVGDTAYVTLQENNALGVFDINASAWSGVIPIPPIEQTIDANDKDGVSIDDTVMCLPMPDQIVHAQGALFFPGEGDARREVGEGGLEDHARLGDLVEMGRALPQPGLERLKVCSFTGDTDRDGVIDVPHAFGSRALHKYDLWTKTWSDTGNLIERTIAERFPDHFDDARSDDRGPEPEGITVGEIEGRTVLFVSIERPGAVMAFDTSLNFLGMVMSAEDGHTGPEGMCFVPKDQSPLGVDTLAVAFEQSGHVVLYKVALSPD